MPKMAALRREPSAPVRRSEVNAVFLVGFMGAGKSTVGRALAAKLNWAFEDLDERIEHRQQRTVPEIFRVLGEPAFRQAETEALRQVLEELHSGVARVVALGGGAFAQQRNLQLLAAAGAPTMFLDAPVDELWRRCCAQGTQEGSARPLLQSVEQFQKLFAARRDSYARATKKIDTHARPVDDIAAEIVRKLRLRKIQARVEQGEVE